MLLKCQLRKINALLLDFFLSFSAYFKINMVPGIFYVQFIFFSLIQTITSNKYIVFCVDSGLGHIKCIIFIYIWNL